MRASRFVFALCLLYSSVAFAQARGAGDDARVMASAHFRRGVELFHEEAFRAALVEFQRAYEIAPDFRLLYNIGQTKLELQDYLGAAQSYERYLAEGYLDIAPERRTEVETALTALRERVGSIAIKANRNDAEIMLDDVRIGIAPISAPIMVNVGRHRVTARTPYGAVDTKVVDVAGGDVASVTLELAKPTPQQVVVMQGEKPLNAMERTAIATWSTAGAIGIGALVTGLMANGSEKDLNKMLETRDLSRKSLGEQRDKVNRLAITTDVLIGAAAAAAIAGTVTWLLGHERESEPEEDKKKKPVANVRMNVGLGSLGLTGQF